ncbi:MAG: hypothetical protein Tsb009_24740 [Planctomycetaceae bacterium]
MSRTVTTLVLGTLSLVTGMGCAHFMEAHAISRFAKAMEQKDMETLKLASSDEFQQKALRSAEALDDLKILHLPKGKTSVVKVSEGETPDEKKVTVEVGKTKKKLLYKLTRNPETGKWQVHDIYMKQKKQGLVTVRSVTEQMDLLITVREFLDAWNGTKRQKILEVTTPQLKKTLAELPDPYLTRLCKQIVGKKSRSGKIRPKAELDGSDAFVTLPRSTGKMVMSFRQIGGKWKLSDVAVESKGEKSHVPSVIKTATALNASLQFLKSFDAADKRGLAKICTPRLYRESLAHADLSAVKIQPVQNKLLDYDLKMQGNRGDFILRGPNEWLRISLTRNVKNKDADSPTEYLVEDVTIYKLNEKQQIRISSLFMAREVLRVFAKALAQQDRDVLRNLATSDFNQRVWEFADAGFIRSIVPSDLMRYPPVIKSTRFNGPVTQIVVRQGNRDLTYIIRDKSGRVRVDDILMPEPGLPASLRERFELQLPIYRYATAIQQGDISVLQRYSSKDFNRQIWKQTKTIPSAGLHAPRFLAMPPTSIIKNGEKTIVVLGDSTRGAKVLMTSEFSRPVIDDILLIAGVEPNQQARLKQTMRFQIQGNRSLTPYQNQQNRVQQAMHQQDQRTQFHKQPGKSEVGIQPDESAFRNPPIVNQPAPNLLKGTMNARPMGSYSRSNRSAQRPSSLGSLPGEETHPQLSPTFTSKP